MKISYILLIISLTMIGLLFFIMHFFPEEIGIMKFLVVIGAICVFSMHIVDTEKDISHLKKYTCSICNFFKGKMLDKKTTMPTSESYWELSDEYKKYTKIGLVLMGMAVISVFISLFISEFFPQANFLTLFLIPIIGIGVTIGPLIMIVSLAYELFDCEKNHSSESKEKDD